MTPLVSTEEIGAASDDELIDLVDQWGDAYMEDEGIVHNLVGRDLMYELLHRWKPQYRPVPESGEETTVEPVCICPRFRDTGGFRIADLGCPIHGVGGTNPGDGPWEDEKAP